MAEDISPMRMKFSLDNLILYVNTGSMLVIIRWSVSNYSVSFDGRLIICFFE